MPGATQPGWSIRPKPFTRATSFSGQAAALFGGPAAALSLGGQAAALSPGGPAAALFRGGLAAALCLALGMALAASPAIAQDWGSSEDDWSAASGASAPSSSSRSAQSQWGDPADTPWSLRAGLGFTQDPDDFLLNFGLDYRFDQYVSAGTMLQVGLEDQRSIVAPTANVTITVPDLPGENLDQLHPFAFAGVGFAVIENDDRGGDTKQTGFLVNTGFGLDYQLSERFSVGSRMIFNFLPGKTLDERFFYSWEVAGVKVSF